MNRALLSLVLLTAISILQGADVDATEKKNPTGTVEQIEESRRGTWRPRERTVGWGADKRGGAMRIKDGDRKKPARDRKEWIKWKKGKGAGRAYRNATDEEYHARIYEESEAMVADNQAAFARREALYELELNKFADYSEEEIDQLGIGEVGRRAALEDMSNLNETELHVSHESSNSNRVKRANNYMIDYRRFLGPVRNQMSCGSCYAFAAVAAIEARIKIKYNISVDLSEQQAVDCSVPYGNGGCSGGWMHQVFRYIQEVTGGLVTEHEYPYKNTRNSCPALPIGVPSSKVSRYVRIPTGDETALSDALVYSGPVSIAYNAGTNAHALYKQGILDAPNCGNNPTHAVLIVGQGFENGVEYWILRNSWGTDWGERGYFRMRRGANMCGVADWASYPYIV